MKMEDLHEVKVGRTSEQMPTGGSTSYNRWKKRRRDYNDFSLTGTCNSKIILYSKHSEIRFSTAS